MPGRHAHCSRCVSGDKNRRPVPISIVTNTKTGALLGLLDVCLVYYHFNTRWRHPVRSTASQSSTAACIAMTCGKSCALGTAVLLVVSANERPRGQLVVSAIERPRGLWW